MDDKYIKDIYDNLGGKEVFGEYNDYYEMITTDESYIKDVYDNMGGVQTFGEFEDFISLLKKKDTTQSDLEKSILDSSKSTEPTVSDSKEDPFLESLLERDEEVAKVDLSKKLLGKGFSVTETGIGDALKIIDNITGEEVDIDLQPVFGIGKGKDIEKLRKLINSSTDAKRELLSKNQYDDFVNDTEGYFQSLNKFYPGFKFETDGMTATISKDGDVISSVDIRNKSTKDFSELNKLLYDNIKNEDVSKLLDDESKEYDLIQEKIKDIESKVDISMERSEEDIYDKDYLSKTLEYLEKKGKDIDPELKEKAKDARANKELFKKVLSDQFQNDPEALSMIEDFNNFLTLEKRDESISRAKKLAIENYFETRPDRGALMEIVNKKHKQADDEEKRILANVEQAKKDLKKMYTSIGNDLKDLSKKNPGVKIDIVTDENGVPIDLVSSQKIDGLDQVKQKIIGGIKTFIDFAEKSEKDFNTLISNKESIEKIKDASKRNYGALDMFAADVKSGYVNLIGSLLTLSEISQPGTAGVAVGLEGKEMIDKNRETMEEYFKSKRTYDEAIKEGSKFEFSYRTFGEQFANVSLAIASAGAGTSIGLSNAATQAVIATTFGASAAGSKYNEMQNRIEAASKAKQALKDLEKTKGKIPVEKYLNEKYELERATKDLDLSQEQIVGSVIASGVVEGTITRYLGTVPNAFKVLKGVRTGTKDFIRNYYRTNLKAIKDAGISIGKATGGEIIEETSIDFLTQVGDYLFLGDAIDISTLDDTAVMAIVTSGGMNVPSTAFGTIMTQVGASRYRSKVGKFADDINKLKNLLKDESLGGVARTLIHNKITENIKKIAEITNEMEADALAVGADGIKDLVMLKNMKDSLLKEAGVKADDTQEVVKAKIDNHLKKQKDNDFRDKLEYVSKKKNEILSDIDYDSAIDKIFGEKGREMADGLDSKLTAKEKFIEVYKNFKKGIQEQIKEEITKEEVVKEPVPTQVSPQTKVETVEELLDRPISLTELGGSKLDTPIEGIMYLDGQQVVVEDENGNITEIGNVDEISEKTLEEMGIKQQMPTVNVQKDGNLEIEGKIYNIESGRIKRDNKGNIVSVTIDQVDKPRSKTLRGRDAEDAAYQILLRKAESPEQTQRINEILEQDEEFKNELRKAEDTAKEDAAKDPEQDTREEIVKIDYFGEELEIKKSTLESTLEESKTKEGFANFNVIIPREKGNVKLGFMSLKKTADNTYEVSLSSLDMSLNLGNKAEGKGLGTMMYEKLIEYANKNGITINNSDNMNEKSSSVWKKLEKKGLVSFVDGKYTNKIVEDTREAYFQELKDAIESEPGKYWSVSPIETGTKGKVIEVEGGKAFVKEDGDIAGLFVDPNYKGKGVAARMLAEAVKQGGIKLDNFVTGAQGVPLQKIYEKAGFRVVARTPFNEKYAPKGWTPSEGKPDVVAMVYDPEGKMVFEEKTFKDPENGYDLMIDYRNKVIEDQEKVEDEVSKLKKAIKGDLDTQVENARKAIAEALPDVEIVIHDTREDFKKATGDIDRGSFDGKTIHINRQDAIKTTVAHEVFHALFLKNLKSDKQAMDLAERFVKALYPALSAETRKKLDNFAKMYKGKYAWLKNEERLAEFFGMLASEYDTMPKPKQNLVKKFLDRLAKMFGLKPITTTEVSDLLYTLAGKVAKGEVITEEDLPSGRLIENPIETINRRQVGLFDVVYTEDAKREELIKNKLLTEPDSWTDFSEMYAAITSPDDMLAGTISINGKQIFEGGGGVFFVTKYGDVWASGREGTANTLVDMINDSFDKNNGRGLLVLAKGSDQKLISSVSGVDSSLAILDVMFDRGMFTATEFKEAARFGVKETVYRNELKKKVTEYKTENNLGLKDKVPADILNEFKKEARKISQSNKGDIKLGRTSGQIKKDLRKYFSDPKTSTFEVRGNVIKELLGKLAQQKTVKQNKDKIIELLGGDKSKGLGKGATPKQNSLGDLVALLAAEKLTKGLKTGDIYAIIEVKSKVKRVEDDHPSYPQHVKTVDGSKPILHLLKKRDNGFDSFTTKTNKKYKVGNVSVMSGSFNKDRKQIVGEKAVMALKKDSALELAKEMEADLKGKDYISEKDKVKSIFKATGFERGVDGKWRFEIPFGSLKVSESGDYKLSDVYVAPELYTAYPSLKDIKLKIEIQPGHRQEGFYDVNEKEVSIRVKEKGQIMRYLVHELQHDIQMKEGFAMGGTPSIVAENQDKIIDKATAFRILELKSEKEAYNSFLFLLEYVMGEFEDVKPRKLFSQEFLKENLEAEAEIATERLELYGREPSEVLSELYSELSEDLITKIEIARRDFGYDEVYSIISEIEGEITEELNKFDLFNMYERLAGEVESRNVERRLYGQIGLISSTESVSREDQLLLFKEDVFPTRKQRVEDVNKILDKQGLNTMTTEQGVDLVKALDNWAMWYEGISEYLEDNFNEYASDILAMLPPSSMNASSAATVGLSINNAERIYKGEEPKGMGSRYAKTWLEGNDIDSNKMYEFARALMGDPNGIAVDMHVWSVYKGFSTTRSPANIKQFNETKKFVLAVSEASGMEPRQVQAALWAANIIKSGNNPTSYIDIFEKHFNENGLHDRVDSWRINGYKPFSTLRIEREKALIALGKKKTIEEKFPGALFIRKQRKAGFDIIEKAKTLGISDAAIRKYFIEQGGLTLEQADELVEDYNEMMRKEGLKREGVRVISNKTLKSLDSVKKFLTSAKAYKPKSMQIGQESRDGFIEANVKKAEFYLRKLNKIAKDEEVLENLELYMRGDKSVDLPDNVAEIAFLMREHIDALSKQLINSGAVEADESVENIMNNIGSYMTRSYEVFTNKDWKNQVSDQVIQEAKNFLRKEYMEQAEFIAMKENRPVDKVLEEYVDSTVSKLLKKEEAMSYVKMANESKKSLGILKRRGDIPAPLRALMGEYKSPAQNYIISVQKVATLAAQQRFLNEMVEAGKGVWLFEKNKAPEGFRVEIATEGSKTMNPLNGLYTSKEIAEELKGSGLVDPEGIFSKAKPLYDFYQKAVGLVKFNKTILSPGTHAKNFIGNLFFMAANGYIDPKDYYTSTRVVLNDLAEGTNEVLNEKMLEYIDAGIINQSATLRDLKDMMAGKENRVDSQEDFEKRMIERFNKPNNKFVKGVKRASEIAQNMYQAEDDFFKIVAYEANKQRYAKAYHKKPFEQLNDTQKKEVLDKVKEIVKNTLPNYNRIAEVRRLIRAVPFTGTFISFHMEAIRTAANTLSLTYEELKDPRTRTIGMQRLTGIGVLFALKFTLIPMITNALVGDDDELEKSARRVLPPWSKDSNIVIESVDNGVLRYRDLSASDPWGVVDKVINAARYREDTLDGFVGVIEETLSPFVTEDILFAAIKDATSKTSKSNTTSENIDVVVNAIYKAFSPGALTSAERIFIEDKKSLMDLVAGKTLSYKKDDKTNEIVGQLTGFKSREIKLKDAAFFKFRDIASAGYGKSMPGAARNASGSYSKAWYDYTNKKISKAKLDKSYEESNKKYKEVLETTLADYKAFIKLGLSPREIKEQMKKAGFNQTEIKYISRGYIPNLKKKKR